MPDAPCARTVLVVEDEPAVRLLVTSILEGAGYTTIQAEDGSDAIRALDQSRSAAKAPCAVLLDMMLPVVDGLGVLRHLAAGGHSVPVVAMSGSSGHLAAAAAAGVQATLAKPFSLDDLLDLVRQFCGEPKQH
jgi:CheY-like chemotaxis protein